jgi:hypothetical protein
MYATVRRYQNAGALGDAMVARSDEVKSLITSVPGFVSYYASRDGDMITSLTICNDKAGCDESTSRARAWVKENVASPPAAPDVSGGTVFLNFSK